MTTKKLNRFTVATAICVVTLSAVFGAAPAAQATTITFDGTFTKERC